MIEERMRACRQLPFNDNHFSLILCSHLLFLYDDSLDYQFHLDFVRELLRVTSKEVRIYSIVCLQGERDRSSFVERIQRDISDEGDAKIVEVNYRFRKGGNEMMKIKKLLQ